MKYEEDRNQRISEENEKKIEKLEDRIGKLRARLASELSILARHKTRHSEWQAKGKEVTRVQEQIDNKHKLVAVLDLKLEELELTVKLLRDQIERLLHFNPVQDAIKNMPTGYHVATEGEWEIKNSRFKTFQDVFTPVGARVLPNNHQALSRDEFDDLTLDACPVDPELVPEWFVEEFGLGDLQDMRQFEALERKVALTPEIRNLFMHLNPLVAHGASSHRLMVLEDYDPKHDGKILKFAYTGEKKEEDDSKRAQSYDSIYAAHRSAHYVDEGYVQEEAKIHGIKARVKGIQKSLIGKHENDPEIPELTDRLLEEIALLLDSRAYYKVAANDILIELADLKDSLGKFNPGRACARMVKALNTLEKRLPQMFQKNRWNVVDRQVIGSTIVKGKEIMDIAFQDHLDLCRLIEKGGRPEAIRGKLAQLTNLDKLRVRPFSLYAATLRQKTEAIKAALEAGNMDAVRDSAIDAYVAAKTFQAQHERERILRDIAASPMEVSVDELLKRARELRKNVRDKQTFPGVYTCSNDAYTDMEKQLDKLVRGLEHYNAKALTEPERQAMYERLKLFLQNINFTEVLEKLPRPATI